MSSPRESETQRDAMKANQGRRLLDAGDYEGAITACTEAIELEPGSIGARRTRAEAYRRLGREKEAEADLKHLGDLTSQRDRAERMPWLDEVNAVWRQVGREVGAAFELREYDPGASDIAFGAALVRRTERWDIALQYRAECEYAHSDAGDDFKTTTMMKAVAKTETAFRFNIGRDVWPDDWSIKIDGRRYGVEGNNKNKIRVLLDDQMIRSLIPTALGSSSLDLRRSQLSFSEKSENQVPGAWKKVESYNWMLPIRDPGRLKALFRLFEAVLDRLEQLEVQEVAEIMTA